MGLQGAVGEEPSREYQLKAAVLYKFTHYIEWEGSAYHPESATSICVVGRDPFQGVLQDLVRIKDPDFRRTVIEYPKTAGELRKCRLVFLSRAKEPDIDRFIEATRGFTAVTVSDIPGFAHRGGIIELVVEGDSSRFIINQAKARDLGIRLSSQLLALARELITEGQE